MLGGGIYVTQNKTLPGSYINFVNATNANSTVGERGVVAIALNLGKNPGSIIEITKNEFMQDSNGLLGKNYDAVELAPL
jgi:N-acetylglutamate synthase/N-acetylornithine aminotransferase